MADPRRFAPLNPELLPAGPELSQLPKLKAVVFDVDGTLSEPQTWMFAKMREALGITKDVDILDHIYTLEGAAQEEGHEKIRAVEREAMASIVPQVGLLELMDYLDSRGIPKAICTRNHDMPVNHLISTYLPKHLFHPIITREFRPPKPHPAGIIHIAQELGLDDAKGTIMVGDSVDDMMAGRRAGSATVLLENPVNTHCVSHENTDVVVSSLRDLIPMLENGFVGRDPAAIAAAAKASTSEIAGW